MFYCHPILIVYTYQYYCSIRHVNPCTALFCNRYARRPDQWRASQTSKETTQRKFQVEFGSNSKPVGQNIEDLFSSQTPTKKRKQKESTDKIAEDSNTTKQDLSQKGKNKRLKPAKATTSKDDSSSKKHPSEGASTSGSVAFMKGSGKRKPPGFLSDKPSRKKQKHQRPTPGKSDGKKLVHGSTSMPFVKNTGKQKQSIAELAGLAGKEKLSAEEVRKLLKPKMSG
jgi:nucleolar protein 9